MPVTNSLIDDLVTGDDYTLARQVTGMPAGVTLAKAWLTIKHNSTETDSQSLVQKIITGFASSAGQVTDIGSSGTATLQVLLTPLDTIKLQPNVQYVFDLQAQGSNGAIRTIETGIVVTREQITISS